MQPKSRTRASLFLATLTAALGCSATPPSATGPAPGEPLTLRVACPPGPAEELIRRQAKGWEGRNDAVVEIVRYAPDEGPADGADAWVIEPAELGRWAAAGRLLPVPDVLKSANDPFNWAGLLPLYREQLLVWDRTAYALPLLGEAPLFCYRSDLFGKAEHQAAFAAKHGRPLKPPATWREVEEAAAYFAAATGAPSLPPLPDDDDGLERLFYTVAAGYAHKAVSDINAAAAEEAFSFHYDLKTGKPLLGGPGFVRALALLRRLQKYRAPGGGAPAEAFRRGVGVCCLTDAAWVRRLQDAKSASAVRDRFDLTPPPEAEVYFAHAARPGDEPVPRPNRTPYLGAGGWLSVVPRSSPHPEEAFALLADLGGRETSRQVVLSPRVEPPTGGGVSRVEQLDVNARWEAFDLVGTRTKALREAVGQTLEHEHPKVANPVYRLRTPSERPRRAVLIRALREALAAPRSDPAEMLAAAKLAEVARRWEEMDHGDPRHLEEYRVSLGLRAR